MTRGLIVVGSAVALVATPLWMAAQQQPSTQPAGVTSPADTTPAATPPATPPVAANDTAQPTTVQSEFLPKNDHVPTTQISIRFKDAPLDSVLQYLSQKAGYTVIKVGGQIDLRVTVWKDTPMSPEEAVSLLNTLLLPSGYTAIVQGKILKVASRLSQVTSTPVFVGDNPDEIPLTDDLRTQVIPLKAVDAVKLKTDLAPLVATDVDLTANAASNSLMLTDTAVHIHRIVEITSNLDKTQATENDIIVQQLKFADATATAKLIMDIFQSTGSGGGGGGTQNNPFASFFGGRGGGGGGGGFGGGGPGGGGGGQGGGGGGRGAAAGEEAGKTGTVTASADTRTNTIVITGPKETLAEIKTEILDKIDNDPSANQTFFTYHVKNGQAVDMQATVNALFGGTTNAGTNRNTTTAGRNTGSTGIGLGSSGGSGLSGGGGGRGGGGGGGGLGGGGLGTSTTGGNTRAGTGGGGGFGGFGGGGGGFVGSAGSSATSSLYAALVGQVEVVADSDTNTLLVLTATKYRDQVESIIKDLDRPVPQVLIKCLIAEVTHDRSDDLGVDFSILNLSRGLSGGSNEGNLTSALTGGAGSGLAVSLAESQLATTFHALAVAGKLDVLSRPYILTSDNQEANILVGQDVPFINNSRTDANGNLINTIQYQNVGIILDVTPHINADGLVVMDVNPEISSIANTTVTIQAGVQAVVFNTRSASSRVGVRDGDTIVIGGLMQDQKTQTVNKVPLLGDIPWLGLLFQRDQVTKTKTELLIFLTPHVAQSPDNLQSMSTDEMKGVHLTPGAVQPGIFQEQIKDMKLGGSTTQPSLPVPKPEHDRDAWEPEPHMP